MQKKVLNRIPKRSLEKDGKKVSVTKICSQLGCSRQTFYNINHRKIKQDNSTKIMRDKVMKIRKYPKRKLIHHSDRGFQYTSEAFTQRLKNQKIKISMTTKYDPYENAIAERVNGIL